MNSLAGFSQMGQALYTMARRPKPCDEEELVELARASLNTLRQILAAVRDLDKPKPDCSIRFGFNVGKPQLKGKHMPLELTITNEQKIGVTIKPVTATGRPASVDGVPVWTVQSGDSPVNVAPDGLSATLVSSDTPGDTIVLVEADADLGQGVITISDTIRLSVQGAMAANLGLSAGTPEPK